MNLWNNLRNSYSVFGRENNYSNNFLLHFLVTLWNNLASNKALRTLFIEDLQATASENIGGYSISTA